MTGKQDTNGDKNSTHQSRIGNQQSSGAREKHGDYHANTHQQNPNRQEPKRSITDQIIAWSPVAISVVTAVITCGLFYTAWEANTVAARSASTAQQAVELASENARHELRAYVFAVEAKVSGDRITVTVRNSGKTPAFETSIVSKVQWEEQMVGMAYLPPGEMATLAPGEEFRREHTIDSREFGRGNVLHVEGAVCYTDIFDEERKIPFHYVQKDRRKDRMSAVSTE